MSWKTFTYSHHFFTPFPTFTSIFLKSLKLFQFFCVLAMDQGSGNPIFFSKNIVGTSIMSRGIFTLLTPFFNAHCLIYKPFFSDHPNFPIFVYVLAYDIDTQIIQK